MLTLTVKGDWSKSFDFLQKASDMQIQSILEKFGERGVEALASTTPKRTGRTASSWSYSVNKTGKGWEVNWENSNVNQGVNIALIIQEGHGTGTGGYVSGIDYINPALGPVFNQLADEAFREVTSA